MIAIMLFQLAPRPAEDLKSLKDTVFLTNQNYRAELISEKTELFGLENAEINYRGIAVSWKQILCYWYVYGCDVGFEGVDTPKFYETMDVESVRDVVENTVLTKSEMDKMTDCFNLLNTIITYPDSSIVDYDRIVTLDMSEEDIEKYVNEDGYYYDEVFQTLYKPIVVESLSVDIDRLTAYEAAETQLKHLSNYDAILDHIDRCIRAVDEDDSSLEPVFYEMWTIIKKETGISIDGRDLITKEGFALPIYRGYFGIR